MLTYIVRRLLYSVVVLFVASFLVFSFVSLSGDPLAALRVTPNYDPNVIERIEEQKNLNDPIPVQVRVLDEGCGHEPVRDDAFG